MSSGGAHRRGREELVPSCGIGAKDLCQDVLHRICEILVRVVALELIDDPRFIRRILEHLGLWGPEASATGPPVGACDWPANAPIPLTYHPVPDIA